MVVLSLPLCYNLRCALDHRQLGVSELANDRLKTRHVSPMTAWIGIGVLLVLVVGLLATYMLLPGRSPADDAQTAAAIGDMDAAQSDADAKREEKRSAAALL